MTREGEVTFLKVSLDTVSLTALAGWAVGWLPAVATVLTIAWTIIRILETRTVSKLLRREDETPRPDPTPSPYDPIL